MKSSSDPNSQLQQSWRAVFFGWLIGCCLALWIIVPAEVDRLNAIEGTDSSWIFVMNIDTTPFVPVFIALPVFWLLRGGDRLSDAFSMVRAVLADGPNRSLVESDKSDQNQEATKQQKSVSAKRCWLLVGIVMAVAFVNCWRVSSTIINKELGVTFGELPPAIHDEFSYEFQARTFLDGKFSYPSHPTAPRLFDQFHVVNEGRFASRYFPGTGLWLAQSMAFGNPHWAQWVATILSCAFVFGIGRELACNGVGLLAGLLLAFSPAVMLFGNLSLAHQPTLLGLSLFIFMFCRLMRFLKSGGRTNRALFGVSLASGAGLAFAMLCRPMSAAGIGLPFGVWLATWGVRSFKRTPKTTVVVFSGFALALSFAFGVLLYQNKQISGDAFKTPYQLYTDIYTPRHVFGFDNVKNAKPMDPDRVITKYDSWAENLDGARAYQNVKNRVIASSQWTVGLVAIVVSICVFFAGLWKSMDCRWWLTLAGLISIHVAHIPYWYDGILHWHYVFESCLLLCLIVAAATWLLFRLFAELDRLWMQCWWALVLLASVVVNQFDFSPYWQARLPVGISQFGFSKMKHYLFDQMVEQNFNRPTVLFIKHDPADLHIDYVNNTPRLDREVLYARFPAATMSEEQTIQAARQAFPTRELVVYDVAKRELRRVD